MRSNRLSHSHRYILPTISYLQTNIKWPMLGTYIDKFEGIRVYESKRMGSGYNGGGLALPGIGIIVGKGAFSHQKDIAVLQHEYGHVLQYRAVGPFWFYLVIGPLSLLSAWTNWHGRGHQLYWTEQWANQMAAEYFGKEQWSRHRFPCRDISQKTKFWMGIG